MRSFQIYTALLMLMTFATCDKGESQPEAFSIRDVTYGTCKPVTKSAIDEYLLLDVKDNDFLEIQHINALFNCSPGEIVVTAALESFEIVINEYETQATENCICPYDLSYVIGPLQHEVYTLILQRDGFEVFRRGFTFDSSTGLKLDLMVH